MDKNRGENKYYNKKVEKTSRTVKREENDFFVKREVEKKIDIHRNIIKI